jgi:hypothetical protein
MMVLADELGVDNLHNSLEQALKHECLVQKNSCKFQKNSFLVIQLSYCNFIIELLVF